MTSVIGVTSRRLTAQVGLLLFNQIAQAKAEKPQRCIRDLANCVLSCSLTVTVRVKHRLELNNCCSGLCITLVQRSLHSEPCRCLDKDKNHSLPKGKTKCETSLDMP